MGEQEGEAMTADTTTSTLARQVIFKTAVENKVAHFIRHLNTLPRGQEVTLDEASKLMKASLARVPNWLAHAIKTQVLVAHRTTGGVAYSLSRGVEIGESRCFLSAMSSVTPDEHPEHLRIAEFEGRPAQRWTKAADCPMPSCLGPRSVFELGVE